MKISFETSLHTYMNKVEDLLLNYEANNNLMLGLLNRGFNNVEAYQDGVHLGIVEKNDQVVFAFMQTPPNHWILADIGQYDEHIIRSIAQFLYQQKMEVPSVLGPVEEVNTFVNEWTNLTNQKAVVEMEQLIYQLDEVQVTPNPKGKLTLATDEHKSLIAKWLHQFGVEANMYISRIKADAMASGYINNRSAYLWILDGKPVSMVNNSRRTKHGVTINAVFTPDKYKRKGHATSAVAALSMKLLAEGFQFCSLYTDAKNPTSNSIYRKIGYYETGSSIVYRFESN